MKVKHSKASRQFAISRAQHYRLLFAAQRGDRLLLLLAIAVVLHVGGVSVIQLWQPFNRSQTQSDLAPLDLQTVEFVYLETAEVAVAPDTQRHASINTTAAGEHHQAKAINPGATDQAALSMPKSVTVASSPPIKSELLQPNSLEAVASSGNLLPANHSPGTHSQEAQDKALEPEPESENKSSEPIPDSASTVSPSGTLPLPANSLPPPQASPSPQSEVTPSPSPSTALIAEPPTAPTAPAAPIAPLPPSPVPLSPVGTGLDGLPNPDRDAPGETTVEARQDLVLGEYMASVNQLIYQHWQRIAIDTTREAIVRFTIDRSGRLLDLNLTQPSGSDQANQAAIEAVQDAAPFAPLPQELEFDQLTINFTFTYNVPPSR